MNNTLKTALYIIGIFGLICLFLQLTGRMVHKKPTMSDDLLGDVPVRVNAKEHLDHRVPCCSNASNATTNSSFKTAGSIKSYKVRVFGTNIINELPPTRNPPIVPEMAPVTVGPEPFQI